MRSSSSMSPNHPPAWPQLPTGLKTFCVDTSSYNLLFFPTAIFICLPVHSFIHSFSKACRPDSVLRTENIAVCLIATWLLLLDSSGREHFHHCRNFYWMALFWREEKNKHIINKSINNIHCRSDGHTVPGEISIKTR